MFIGNSASGVARNCDFLADAISTVNSRTRVLCVLDGPSDFTPFWIQDIMTNKSATCGKTVRKKNIYYDEVAFHVYIWRFRVLVAILLIYVGLQNYHIQ